MLFKRIFNWLKLKSITPSTLYRNRLFIERDSKKRRVMSNFGLTFRNSKWSDYALNNVSLKSIERSKVLLMNIFFTFFLLNFLVWFFSTNMNISILTLPREISWLIYDWTTLTLVFTLISYKQILSNALEKLTNVCWSYLFGLKVNTNSSVNVKQTVTFNKSSELHPTTLKNDNLILTTSLIHNLQGNSKTNNTLLNLFRQTNPNKNQSQTLKFYKNLFKLNTHISRSGSDKILQQTLHFNKTLLNVESVLTNPQYKPYFTLIVDFFLKDHKLSNNHSLNHHDLTKWSLGVSDIESLNTMLLKNQPHGVFYLTNFSNQKINENIFRDKQPLVWQQAILQQTQFFKWLRWLYRYNLLHRNVIKSSQKIQGLKKLLSSGFYTSNLTKSNIWVSNALNNSPEQTSLQEAWLSFYSRFFSLDSTNVAKNTSQALVTNRQQLLALKFYETSYFFTLHRFVNFNTLSKLELSSNFTLNKTHETQLNSKQYDRSYWQTVSNLLLKSNTIVQNSYNFYNYSNLIERTASVSTSEGGRSSHLGKNTFIESPRNFLSSKNTLELLQNLNNNSFDTQYNSLFYGYVFDDPMLDLSNNLTWASHTNTYSRQEAVYLSWADAQYTLDLWKWINLFRK